MAKHKEVMKWIAYIKKDITKGTMHVVCCEVKVLETPKQYRLIRGGRACGDSLFYHAFVACGYKGYINKGMKLCPLHDSKILAMEALCDKCVCQVESTANDFKIAKNELQLVLDAKQELQRIQVARANLAKEVASKAASS